MLSLRLFSRHLAPKFATVKRLASSHFDEFTALVKHATIKPQDIAQWKAHPHLLTGAQKLLDIDLLEEWQKDPERVKTGKITQDFILNELRKDKKMVEESAKLAMAVQANRWDDPIFNDDNLYLLAKLACQTGREDLSQPGISVTDYVNVMSRWGLAQDKQGLGETVEIRPTDMVAQSLLSLPRDSKLLHLFEESTFFDKAFFQYFMSCVRNELKNEDAFFFISRTKTIPDFYKIAVGAPFLPIRKDKEYLTIVPSLQLNKLYFECYRTYQNGKFKDDRKNLVPFKMIFAEGTFLPTDIASAHEKGHLVVNISVPDHPHTMAHDLYSGHYGFSRVHDGGFHMHKLMHYPAAHLHIESTKHLIDYYKAESGVSVNKDLSKIPEKFLRFNHLRNIILELIDMNLADGESKIDSYSRDFMNKIIPPTSLLMIDPYQYSLRIGAVKLVLSKLIEMRHEMHKNHSIDPIELFGSLYKRFPVLVELSRQLITSLSSEDKTWVEEVINQSSRVQTESAEMPHQNLLKS